MLLTPYAELDHLESVSRGDDERPEQVPASTARSRYMQARWGHALRADPAYNPNLSDVMPDFSLAAAPRVDEAVGGLAPYRWTRDEAETGSCQLPAEHDVARRTRAASPGRRRSAAAACGSRRREAVARGDGAVRSKTPGCSRQARHGRSTDPRPRPRPAPSRRRGCCAPTGRCRRASRRA